MNKEFIEALNEIEKERGIDKEIIFEALEAALISSYKKNFNSLQNVEVIIDKETGDVKVYSLKEVVEIPENELLEIGLELAKEKYEKHEIGDIVKVEVTSLDFGRIAAQTAKQVVMQRIRDAERDVVYNEFITRENEMITGIIQRMSKNNVYIDLGKTEGMLPPSEQIAGEFYSQGQRLKLLILEVKKTTKGPQIILSRSHPNLIKRLFELEVPEIQEGIVEIYSIAREAGFRTKIAIFSKDQNVDPLGACVGIKGSRVKLIVDELGSEKIDIALWDNDIKKFIANSLSPSKVVQVIPNEKEKSAIVIVPDYQLSLAIGKEGQNARLAAKLTGWRIDIKSETQFNEEYEKSDNHTVLEDNALLADTEEPDEYVVDTDEYEVEINRNKKTYDFEKYDSEEEYEKKEDEDSKDKKMGIDEVESKEYSFAGYNSEDYDKEEYRDKKEPEELEVESEEIDILDREETKEYNVEKYDIEGHYDE